MKKIYITFAILMTLTICVLDSYGQRNWGAWQQHPCHRGVQVRVRQSLSSEPSEKYGYFWYIQFQNNYPDDVEFDFTMGANREENAKDIKAGKNIGRIRVKANSTSDGLDWDFVQNPSNVSVNIGYLEMIKPGGIGGGPYSGCTRPGIQDDFCYLNPRKHCGNFEYSQKKIEALKNSQVNYNPANPSNSNGRNNHSQGLNTGAMNAEEKRVKAEELKQKIFDNLKSNLQNKTFLSGDDQHNYKYDSIEKRGDLIYIQFNKKINNTRHTNLWQDYHFTYAFNLGDILLDEKLGRGSDYEFIYIKSVPSECKKRVGIFGPYDLNRYDTTNCDSFAYLPYNNGPSATNFNEFLNLIIQLRNLNNTATATQANNNSNLNNAQIATPTNNSNFKVPRGIRSPFPGASTGSNKAKLNQLFEIANTMTTCAEGTKFANLLNEIVNGGGSFDLAEAKQNGDWDKAYNAVVEVVQKLGCP